MTGLLLTFNPATPSKDSRRVRGQCLAVLTTKVHGFVAYFAHSYVEL